MPWPPNIRKQLLDGLDSLIQQGQSMPKDKIPRIRHGFSGEVLEPASTQPSLEPFRSWCTSCVTLLSQIIPKEHIHWKWIAAINDTSLFNEFLLDITARLKSVRTDFEQGLFDDILLTIEVEISADYLGQAERLLQEGQPGKYDHVPAAVLSGAVLEKTLRSLCAKQSPPVSTLKPNGETKTMNGLIDDLKKSNYFNEAVAKQLRAWTAIRNHAAHGEFEEFTRQQVENMIPGINNFLANYG